MNTVLPPAETRVLPHCRDDSEALASRASKSGRDSPREVGTVAVAIL